MYEWLSETLYHHRASAAEAAAEAKAFMQPEAPETLEARSREADAKKAAEK